MWVSVSSAVHLSINDSVWPKCIEFDPNCRAAVWYSGAGTRWTLSSWAWMPKRLSSMVNSSALVSGSMSLIARRTPFGFPLVPDV